MDVMKGRYMSVKINISYDSPEELEIVKSLLDPITGKMKISRNNTGKHRRAYIDCIVDGDKTQLKKI